MAVLTIDEISNKLADKIRDLVNKVYVIAWSVNSNGDKECDQCSMRNKNTCTNCTMSACLFSENDCVNVDEEINNDLYTLSITHSNPKEENYYATFYLIHDNLYSDSFKESNELKNQHKDNVDKTYSSKYKDVFTSKVNNDFNAKEPYIDLTDLKKLIDNIFKARMK